MNKNYLFLFLLLLIVPSVTATDVLLFYGEGCPHCAKAQTELTPLLLEDSSINLYSYEVYFNKSNQQYFQSVMQTLNESVKGVPTIIIGEFVFSGYSDQTKQEILTTIDQCHDSCVLPQINAQEKTNHISLVAVVLGAIVDAINPCAFAVLIILLTSLLNKKKKRLIIQSGLAFTAAIFISYFLMGLGLYKALSFIKADIFFLIVAIIAIILGLLNLKDYFWYGKWFVMEVPHSWRPNLQKIIKSVNSPIGSFLVGFLVSLFLLPCTSGPYIAVLGLLAHETSIRAISYLLLYNLIFVIPMAIITCGVAKGIDLAKIEEKRKKHLHTLHLIEGLVLLTLGVLLLLYAL